MGNQYKYNPNYAVHPGITLKELLDEKGMTAKEFAIRTAKPEKTISKIINGKSSITPEMAVIFEKVLDIPAKFWLDKQKNYNEYIARQKYKQSIEQAVNWAKNFPYNELAKLGYVKSTRKSNEKVEELFKFFNISSPNAWEAIYIKQQMPTYFRISLKHKKNPYAISTLLRIAELKAKQIDTQEYTPKNLKKILPELKQIMINQDDNFLEQLQLKLSQAGVIITFLHNLKGTVLNGTVRWLKNNPQIIITDRLKRYDIFWFSLFHEIGHILLHGNKKNIFLEEISYTGQKDEKEVQADKFAEKILLSDEQFKEITQSIDFENLSPDRIIFLIEQYAKKFNTHKDIIIGRILHNNKNLYELGFLQNQITKINFDKI